MKSNIRWIIFFLAVCIICAAIWVVRVNSADGKTIAEIKQGDKIIQTIDLLDVLVPYEFDVTDEHGGHNRIRVEEGRIAVIDADCPDKICVNQGYIKNGAVPIVCLPHKLSITITGGEKEIDAVSGRN